MMAVLRFFIPWQRVIGFIQARTQRTMPNPNTSKDYSQG